MLKRAMLPLAASFSSALVLNGGCGMNMVRTASLSMSARMSELEELKFLVGDKSVGSLHDFEAVNTDGDTVAMSSYQGRTVLVVNVASL